MYYRLTSKLLKFLGHQRILVVTPEKLIYVLRHTPDGGPRWPARGGPRLDGGTRGITYQLLTTSSFMIREGSPEGADFCGHQ